MAKLGSDGFYDDVKDAVATLLDDATRIMEQNLMKLFQNLDDPDEAIKQAVATVFQKVDEKVSHSLNRWQTYCHDHCFSIPDVNRMANKGQDNRRTLEQKRFLELNDDLDRELSILRGNLACVQTEKKKLLNKVERMGKHLNFLNEVSNLIDNTNLPIIEDIMKYRASIWDMVVQKKQEISDASLIESPEIRTPNIPSTNLKVYEEIGNHF